MKIAWRKKAAERYRSLMCSVRNGKEKRLSLTEGVMDAWQSAWGATEYKEKCKKFSNNRKSETGGQGAGPSRHCGGSISQYRHQQQMVCTIHFHLNFFKCFKFYPICCEFIFKHVITIYVELATRKTRQRSSTS